MEFLTTVISFFESIGSDIELLLEVLLLPIVFGSFFIAIAFLPIFVSFEIYQLSRKQYVIQYPIKKGIFFGILWGIVTLIIGFMDTSGEDTLGLIAFSPGIILSFIVFGFITGAIYQKRKTTYILSRIIKKRNMNNG